ncbi:hypothetical protein [Hymenobacter arizonensis]|nr:hypothetical protein [Hymenobacter arizonensis]
MDDWVEVGVFAPDGQSQESGRPLYLQKRRLRSGKQAITLPVPGRPARAGIDPRHLFVDLEMEDNTKAVKLGGRGPFP